MTKPHDDFIPWDDGKLVLVPLYLSDEERDIYGDFLDKGLSQNVLHDLRYLDVRLEMLSAGEEI